MMHTFQDCKYSFPPGKGCHLENHSFLSWPRTSKRFPSLTQGIPQCDPDMVQRQHLLQFLSGGIWNDNSTVWTFALASHLLWYISSYLAIFHTEFIFIPPIFPFNCQKRSIQSAFTVKIMPSLSWNRAWFLFLYLFNNFETNKFLLLFFRIFLAQISMQYFYVLPQLGSKLHFILLE